MIGSVFLRHFLFFFSFKSSNKINRVQTKKNRSFSPKKSSNLKKKIWSVFARLVAATSQFRTYFLCFQSLKGKTDELTLRVEDLSQEVALKRKQTQDAEECLAQVRAEQRDAVKVEQNASGKLPKVMFFILDSAL